ncbi:MAG: endonuclease domain-containing protein [Bacteroidales bacterium]|nr:endonuclease domain-containing protein [Bacteroidales bacterium]
MFYGASPVIFKRASELRKNMTEAEKILWSALRRKQILGKRFRRQHPISTFIVDFYCHETKLIIEVDGSIHNVEEQKEYDLGRNEELEQLGLKIIRFTNEQVFQNLDQVTKEIVGHIILPSQNE